MKLYLTAFVAASVAAMVSGAASSTNDKQEEEEKEALPLASSTGPTMTTGNRRKLRKERKLGGPTGPPPNPLETYLLDWCFGGSMSMPPKKGGKGGSKRQLQEEEEEDVESLYHNGYTLGKPGWKLGLPPPTDYLGKELEFFEGFVLADLEDNEKVQAIIDGRGGVDADEEVLAGYIYDPCEYFAAQEVGSSGGGWEDAIGKLVIHETDDFDQGSINLNLDAEVGELSAANATATDDEGGRRRRLGYGGYGFETIISTVHLKINPGVVSRAPRFLYGAGFTDYRNTKYAGVVREYCGTKQLPLPLLPLKFIKNARNLQEGEEEDEENVEGLNGGGGGTVSPYLDGPAFPYEWTNTEGFLQYMGMIPDRQYACSDRINCAGSSGGYGGGLAVYYIAAGDKIKTKDLDPAVAAYLEALKTAGESCDPNYRKKGGKRDR
jgi:hypothetical protein